MVTPTKDVALIDSVLLALEPLISNDQTPAFLSSAGVVGRPGFLFLKVEQDGVFGGLVMLIRSEVHTLFLPNLRGGAAVRAGREVLAWLWANTPYKYLTSFAYSNRPEVAFFARLMGFRKTTTVDDGLSVGGIPVTRTNFIMERPV